MISNILAVSYFSIELFYFTLAGFPGGSEVKNLPAVQETYPAGDLGSIPASGRSPGEGNGTPLLLPGESHGQRCLEGYSP